MADQTPLDVEAIRARLDAATVGWYEFIHPTKATTEIAHVSESGRVYLPEAQHGSTEEDFRLAAASNRFWRLGRIEELETELAARDRTVEALSARLTAKNAELDKVIREAAADKAKAAAARKALADNVAEYDREIASFTLPTTMSRADEEHRDLIRAEAKEARWCLEAFDAAMAAPEMPRPPAAEADPALIARNDEVDVFCAAHSEYNPYVCVRFSCGHYLDLHAPGCGVCDCSGALRDAPEPANGTAQPGAGDTDTSPAGSGRGTGVAEAPGPDAESRDD